MSDLGTLPPLGGMEDAIKASTTAIIIPYKQREHFKPLHASTKRFRFVVAHRRAGKSVAEINELIKKALQNTRTYPPPRYAYIGPTFAQTKDLIWGYTKYYTGVLPNVKYSEGDLQVTLPNGAMINLYGGGTAYQRMRGLYFDGAVADEYALLEPDMLDSVVRSCLLDYRGWFIASGTSNGDDHFHELKVIAEKNPDEWDIFIIPVTETDALHPDEVDDMRRQIDPATFAREMLCSFEAPTEGAYYADLMNEAETQGRVCSVLYDPSVQVITWWDLGIHDETFIWFLQRVGRELRVIRTMAFTGKGLPFIANEVKATGYNFGTHVLPHDIMARELGTGRSRYEILSELLGDIFVCPMHRVEDGITATRSIIPMCYFDKELARSGIMALRNYHRGNNGKPVHNWASHGSDAYRVGSVAFNQTIGYVSAKNVTSIGGRLRRRIRGIM